MNNRRRFIALLPFAGATVLAACSKEAATPSAAPNPAPMPAPAAAPAAPVTPAPAMAPSPSSAGSDSANSSAGSDLPLLSESDPLAQGLGYVAVANRADTAKFKNYVPGQACGNCSLFAGKAGDAQAPCTLFTGRHVLATGWCSAYAKKVG